MGASELLTLDRVLGVGATGAVYVAKRQIQNARERVAVKVFDVHNPEDAEVFKSRIRDEARLLAMLQHPSIPRVHSLVQLEGRDAVVVELVDGRDLGSVIEAEQRLSQRAIQEVGGRLADALATAHEATNEEGVSLGVVHRDLKPANVMLTPRGRVKLLDFGVARAEFDTRESKTGQLLLGTLLYMAPEGVVRGEVGPASDVYALGLCILELLTLTPLGPPKTRRETHEERLRERLDDPTVGPVWGPVLDQLLHWEPERRPSARDLIPILDGLQMKGAPLAKEAPRVLGALGSVDDADPLRLVGRTFEVQPEPLARPGQAEQTAPRPITATRPTPPASLPAVAMRGLVIGALMGVALVGTYAILHGMS